MDSDLLSGRRLTLTAGLMIVVGLIHLLVTPMHLAEARGAGLFFLVLGSSQILWALLMLREPSHRLQSAGLIGLAIAPSLLFVITRTWRAPFADGPEGIDTLGLAALAVQLAIIGLVKGSVPALRRNAHRTAVAGLAVALVAYTGAVVAEDIHPLAEPEGPHGHAEPEDAHEETGHMDEGSAAPTGHAPNGTVDDHGTDGHGH